MTRQELTETIKTQLLRLFEQERIENLKKMTDSIKVTLDPNDSGAYLVSYEIPVRMLEFNITVDNDSLLVSED